MNYVHFLLHARNMALMDAKIIIVYHTVQGRGEDRAVLFLFTFSPLKDALSYE